MTLENAFNKIVFLLGAGASWYPGCKLSGEMLISLQSEIEKLSPDEPEFLQFKEDFSEIYHFILASLNYQGTLKGGYSKSSSYVNIEDFVMVLRQLIDKEFVVPYPLVGNWNDKILRWELRNGDIFERFKDFITRLLVNDWTQFDLAKAKESLRPVRDLVNKSDGIKANFFTLNYDLIFEEVFNSPTAKILDNGFSEKNVSGEKIRVWSKDFNDVHSPTKINLFKLHGSLDWEYNLETEEISIKESVTDGREPLIIFGSSSKMLSFDPFLYILSKFRELLEEATLFVVIGYSFHDKYINNLLIQQLNQNTDDEIPKKLLVVDPSRTGQTSAEFADELKAIQESKSISDIINFRQMSPDRINLLPVGATEFYEQFFGDGGRELLDFLEETEETEKLF